MVMMVRIMKMIMKPTTTIRMMMMSFIYYIKDKE